MAQLDELKVGALILGLLPGNHPVSIISITLHPGIGAELVYKDSSGQLGSELLYTDRIAELQVVPQALPWRFDNCNTQYSPPVSTNTGTIPRPSCGGIRLE